MATIDITHTPPIYQRIVSQVAGPWPDTVQLTLACGHELIASPKNETEIDCTSCRVEHPAAIVTGRDTRTSQHVH